MASKSDCIKLANDLIEWLKVGIPRLSHFSEINSILIMDIFKYFSSVKLPELIQSPLSTEDHISNIQAIIDCLSLDIINVSLVHISGEQIINGDVQACYNLLKIFLELIPSRSSLGSYHKNSEEASQVAEISSTIPPLQPSIILSSPDTDNRLLDFKYVGMPRHSEKKYQELDPQDGINDKPISSNERKDRRDKCINKFGDKKYLKRLGSLYEVENFHDLDSDLKDILELDNLYFKDVENNFGEIPTFLKEIESQRKKGISKMVIKKQINKISSPIRRNSGQFAKSSKNFRRPVYVNKDEPRGKLKIKKDENNSMLMHMLSDLHISDPAMKYIEQKQDQHIEKSLKSFQFCKNQNHKQKKMINEAKIKQNKISNIIKKDKEHSKRLEELKKLNEEKRKLNGELKDKKIRMAKLKRKDKEINVQLESHILDSQSKDFLIMKNLFEDGMNIMKKRIQQSERSELLRKAHELKLEEQNIDEIELFYRNHHKQIMEEISKEKSKVVHKKKLQAQAIRKAKILQGKRIDEEYNNLSKVTRDIFEKDQCLKELNVNKFRFKKV